MKVKNLSLKKTIKLGCAGFFFGVFAAILLSGDQTARAFSTGPDPGRAGAPGELTCATAECHGTAKNTGPGQFNIIAPAGYEPGQTYQIVVRHQTSDLTRKRWGFQITALTGSNARAGAWRILNDRTQIVEDNLPGFRRQYVEHTETGTFREQTGAASWAVNWAAPATDAGPITFYAAGNQADNNGNNSGDQIYTTQVTISPQQPVAESPLAGSLLFFNLYTSNGVNSLTQNTRISITNTDEEKGVALRIFMVDGADGAVADEFICMTPNQTFTFLASDIDPGVTGYLIAVAVDANGCPIKFNSLTGDEYVKLASGHAASLSAEVFQMLSTQATHCDAGSATLRFDGVNYALAPRTLTLPNIPSRADGNETLLALNRCGGDLRTGAAPLGGISGELFDDDGQAFGFSAPVERTQLISRLSNDFPRASTLFEDVITTGRAGWMKLWLTNDMAALGAAFNINPTMNRAAFNYGANLRRLTLTQTATLTIPIFPPSC